MPGKRASGGGISRSGPRHTDRAAPPRPHRLGGASSRKANKRLIACEIVRNRRNSNKTKKGVDF